MSEADALNLARKFDDAIPIYEGAVESFKVSIDLALLEQAKAGLGICLQSRRIRRAKRNMHR